MKFTLLKLIISLLANKASKQEICLEVGAYFIKRGSNYRVGQILHKKEIQGDHKLYKGKVVTNMWFEFDTNQIHVKRNNRFITPDAIAKK